MTILQLISSEGLYGAENMLIALAKSLTRLGHSVKVAVFHDERRPHLEVAGAARKEELPTCLIPCRGRLDWRVTQTIRRKVAAVGAQVVHSHGYKADVYARAACLSGEFALVSTCHNWPSRAWSMRAYAAIDRLVLRTFDGVATPSPTVADVLLRSGQSSDRLAWISNGVDLDRFRSSTPGLRTELQLGADTPVVAYVGRLVPGKGADVFVHAVKMVHAVLPEARFLVVGDGPQRVDLEVLAAALGVRHQVTFLGTRGDMPSVYASLDVLVLPSFDEAMPMCLLEAMAASKPVIATRVGAVPEAVVTGETGYLVEPGDVRRISDHIVDLLQDRALAGRLGSNGRDRVATMFSSDDMARKYVRLYDAAVAGRHVPRNVSVENRGARA